MSFLSEQLGTDSLGISLIISAIGLGKLVKLSFSGRLSDKMGRKPLVVTATFLNIIFLGGIPLAPNFQVAFVLALIAGFSYSIMDSGTFPALVEAFPENSENSGSATVLLKACVYLSRGNSFTDYDCIFYFT
ncbi:MFS transporter [Neobacillus cucumis]|uniref:MFS transporter n=1 Tax=Neobacillus cucumis TaxID=1740721 RepID=UPI00203E761F|nr:MFS transporter [Neobacillus cucumis]MCM3724623.1 MFS transporter [Neobacillus cucumis]